MKTTTRILTAAALVAGLHLITAQSALANWGSPHGGHCGAPVYHPPVYHPPVYHAPPVACTTVQHSYHNPWQGTSVRQTTTACAPVRSYHHAPVYIAPQPVYIAPPVRHYRHHRHHAPRHHYAAPSCGSRSSGSVGVVFRF